MATSTPLTSPSTTRSAPFGTYANSCAICFPFIVTVNVRLHKKLPLLPMNFDQKRYPAGELPNKAAYYVYQRSETSPDSIVFRFASFSGQQIELPFQTIPYDDPLF